MSPSDAPDRDGRSAVDASGGPAGPREPCRTGVLSADTDARAEAVMVERLRRLSPRERLERAFDLRAAAMAVAGAGVRLRERGLSERETRVRLASLWLDPATVRRVYGPDIPSR